MNQLPKLNIAFCSEEDGDVFFCLKEKPWIIIKKNEIPFLPTRSGTSPCSGLEWLDTAVYMSPGSRPGILPGSKRRDDFSLSAATLIWEEAWIPIIPSRRAPPHFIKGKQNEINTSRGGMKSLKLKESQHQRVSPSSSLNPFYNSGCYDNMMQLYITMTIWHNFQKTVSTVLFCCSIAPKETCCYLLLWWNLY